MSSSAFQSILDAADAPAPGGSARASSAARQRARREARDASNVQPGHRLVFHALTSGQSQDFGLMSCFVNGRPTAMIVMAHEIGDDRMEIVPLFVALTDGLVVTDHDGDVVFGKEARHDQQA